MGLMDKANEFLGSEQGEQLSDQALQQGADRVNEMTGGQHGDKIAQGQQMADDRLGQPGAAGEMPAEGLDPNAAP